MIPSFYYFQICIHFEQVRWRCSWSCAMEKEDVCKVRNGEALNVAYVRDRWHFHDQPVVQKLETLPRLEGNRTPPFYSCRKAPSSTTSGASPVWTGTISNWALWAQTIHQLLLRVQSSRMAANIMPAAARSLTSTCSSLIPFSRSLCDSYRSKETWRWKSSKKWAKALPTYPVRTHHQRKRSKLYGCQTRSCKTVC